MLISEKPTVFKFENLDLFNFNNLVESWGLDFNQLESGKLSANFTQLLYSEFQLGYAQFNLAVKQEGYSPQGFWTFAFVNDVQLHWRNFNVQPQSIIIYSPGSEISAVSRGGFEVLTLSISEQKFKQFAKDAGDLGLLADIKNHEVLQAKGDAWTLLRKQLLSRIKKANETLTLKEESEFYQNTSQTLLELLSNAAPSKSKVSGKQRLELISRVERYIQLNLTESLTVSSLAKQFNVSERTLLYAFHQRFQIGPKAFFKVLKLNHIYHEFNNENGTKSVSSIANLNGFSHLGQFYKDYKAFFSELPSETMKRNQSQ